MEGGVGGEWREEWREGWREERREERGEERGGGGILRGNTPQLAPTQRREYLACLHRRQVV